LAETFYNLDVDGREAIVSPNPNFHIIDSCVGCPVRHERLFCDLSDTAIKELERMKSTAFYPKGAFLCLEGQQARGIYLLCNGRAKISASAEDGKTIILGIAAPGEVLGLSAVVSAKPYEVTIETLEPTQANFIPASDFLKFLGKFPEVGVRVAKQLTHTCQTAFEEIRSLGLSHSVPERLARLLLQWCDNPSFVRRTSDGLPQLKVVSTQEEIAQMIGTSRETVSRVIADLKKSGVIRVKGASWTIVNRPALQRRAGA
jgi:CRP/FNR family transcriptional regulator, cyclic AMP receptor protein